MNDVQKKAAKASPVAGPAGNGEKSERKGRKKERVITFVYSSKAEPGLHLFHHRTTLPTLGLAWDECLKSQSGIDVSLIKLEGALQGHVDWLKDKLRKPTYKELEEALNSKK